MRPLRAAPALSPFLSALVLASLAFAGEIPDLPPPEEALVAGRFEKAARGFEMSAKETAEYRNAPTVSVQKTPRLSNFRFPISHSPSPLRD